eukprot:1042402-Pleurochrysis_carterae.AAC.1
MQIVRHMLALSYACSNNARVRINAAVAHAPTCSLHTSADSHRAGRALFLGAAQAQRSGVSQRECNSNLFLAKAKG